MRERRMLEGRRRGRPEATASGCGHWHGRREVEEQQERMMPGRQSRESHHKSYFGVYRNA